MEILINKVFILGIVILANMFLDVLTIGFIQKPQNSTVNVGQNITMVCTANTTIRFYSWLFVPSGSSTSTITKIVGYCYFNKPCINYAPNFSFNFTNESQMKILNVTKQHYGKYICQTVSTKSAQTFSVEAYIFVRTPPESISIKFNKSRSIFKEHEFIGIYCTVRGSNPIPTVTISIISKLNEITNLNVNLIDHKRNNESDDLISSEIQAVGLWCPSYKQHLGRVICTAKNEAGQLFQKSAPLDITFEPKIQKNLPHVINALVNQILELSCLVVSNPPASVVWVIGHNQQRIASPEFLVTVKSNMTGPLTCHANNSVGSRSRITQLVVLSDPKIKLAPVYHASEHSDWTVTCNVKSIPPPFIIQWYKVIRTSETSSQRQTLVSNDAELHFLRLDRSSSGVYVCIAKNKQTSSFGDSQIGRDERNMTLIVTYKPGSPRITTERSLSITKGCRLFLQCSNNIKNPGVPEPNLQWINADTEQIVANSSIYRVENAQHKDSGRYQCAAVNTIDTVRSHDWVEVTINEPPKFYNRGHPDKSRRFISPVSEQIQSTQFACSFVGHPRPAIQWFYASPSDINDLQPIKSSGRYSITLSHHSRDPAATHSSLLTVDLFNEPNMNPANEIRASPNGKYRCVATNAFGIASHDFYLVIKYPPKIKSSRHNRKVAVVIGQSSIKIRCQVESALNDIRIAWEQQRYHGNKRQITNKPSKYAIFTTHQSRYEPHKHLFSPAVVVSELEIYNLAVDDISNYSCIAANDEGRSQERFQVVFKSKPDSPVNLQMTDTTWDSITLSWESGFDGGLEQNFHIQVESMKHGKQSVPFYSNKPFNKLTITGLYPYTNYSISVYSENLMGSSLPSSSIHCTTKRFHKFSLGTAKLVPGRQRIEIKLPDQTLCASIEYSTDNGNHWISLTHCSRTESYNYSQSHNLSFVLISFKVDRITSLSDIQSGLVRFRVTYCILKRPSVCSKPQLLKNPRVTIMTQTLIMIIAGFCILLMLVLAVLFIVCCLHLHCPCYSNEDLHNNNISDGTTTSHTNYSSSLGSGCCRMTRKWLWCCYYYCFCHHCCQRYLYQRRRHTSNILIDNKLTGAYDSNQFIHHNKHHLYPPSTHSYEEDENNNTQVMDGGGSTVLTTYGPISSRSPASSNHYSPQNLMLLANSNHNQLPPTSSSFMCPHLSDQPIPPSKFTSSVSGTHLMYNPPIHGPPTPQHQVPRMMLINPSMQPHQINTSALPLIPVGPSSSSCEASSSYSQHSSQGSSSIHGNLPNTNGTTSAINRVKFRPKQDNISLNSLTNTKYANHNNNNNSNNNNNTENIKMPDVTTEAIQYMRPINDDSDKMAEVRI